MLGDWLGSYEDDTEAPTEKAAGASMASLSSEDALVPKKHPLQTLAHALVVATPSEMHQAQLLALGGTKSVPSVLETSTALPDAGVYWANLGVEDMIEMLTCMPTLGTTTATDDVLDWLLSFTPRTEDQLVATDNAHSNSSTQPHPRAATGTDLAPKATAITAAGASSGEEDCSSTRCKLHATESLSTVTSTPVLSEQSFTPRDSFEDQYSSRSSGPSAHGHLGHQEEDFSVFDAVTEWELEFFLRSVLSDICQQLKLRKRAEAHKLIREAREQLRDWREHH